MNSFLSDFLVLLSNVLSPNNVLLAQLDNGLNPAHQTTQDGHAICIDVFMVVCFQTALDVVKLLITVVLRLLWSKRIVVNQLLHKVSTAISQLSLGFLPCKLVGIRLALLLALRLEEIEEALPDAWILDHCALVKGIEALLEKV